MFPEAAAPAHTGPATADRARSRAGRQDEAGGQAEPPADPTRLDAGHQPRSPCCPLSRLPHDQPLLSSGAPQGLGLHNRNP